MSSSKTSTRNWRVASAKSSSCLHMPCPAVTLFVLSASQTGRPRERTHVQSVVKSSHLHPSLCALSTMQPRGLPQLSQRRNVVRDRNALNPQCDENTLLLLPPKRKQKRRRKQKHNRLPAQLHIMCMGVCTLVQQQCTSITTIMLMMMRIQMMTMTTISMRRMTRTRTLMEMKTKKKTTWMKRKMRTMMIRGSGTQNRHEVGVPHAGRVAVSLRMEPRAGCIRFLWKSTATTPTTSITMTASKDVQHGADIDSEKIDSEKMT
mmetsp:Transcript_7281/g.14253  ORF Transcript_7281/g.14253 Transcript_7281/m.14253 type:complete len:262 (-) Transcript_7281:21-806(-)